MRKCKRRQAGRLLRIWSDGRFDFKGFVGEREEGFAGLGHDGPVDPA